MFFAWRDKVAAATVSCPNAVPSLPVQNVQVNPVARHMRVASGTCLLVDVDFGATTPVRAVGFMAAGQGFDPGAGATVDIRLSDSVPGGSDVYGPGPAAYNFAAGHGQAFHPLPAGLAARHMRVELCDATVAGPDLGRLVAYGGAGFWEPSKNHRVDRQWLSGDTGDASRRALHGNRLRRPGARFRQLEFALGFIGRAEMLDNGFAADLEAGLMGDVLVMLDPDGEPTRESIWGAMTQLTPMIGTVGQRESKRFLVEQEL